MFSSAELERGFLHLLAQLLRVAIRFAVPSMCMLRPNHNRNLTQPNLKVS